MKTEDSRPSLTRRSVEPPVPPSFSVPCKIIRHRRTRIPRIVSPSEWAPASQSKTDLSRDPQGISGYARNAPGNSATPIISAADAGSAAGPLDPASLPRTPHNSGSQGIAVYDRDPPKGSAMPTISPVNSGSVIGPLDPVSFLWTPFKDISGYARDPSKDSATTVSSAQHLERSWTLGSGFPPHDIMRQST